MKSWWARPRSGGCWIGTSRPTRKSAWAGSSTTSAWPSSRRNWVCRRSDPGFQFRWLPSNWFPRLQTSWVTLSLPRSSKEALGILPEFVTPGGGPWLIAALNPSTSSRLGTLVFVKLLLRKVASGQWLVIRKKCSPPSSLSVLLGKVPVGAVRFKSFS